MRRALVLALLLGIAARASASFPDLLNPVPTAGASFMGQLQTFLKNEDAQRFNEQFHGFVVSGCLGLTSAGLTHTPSSCIAYPGGYRSTETGSVTYSDASTCWTVIHKDVVGNLTTNVTWTRTPGTHYLTNCTNIVLPTIPADTVLLMRVSTSGGAITAVDDLRVTWPVKARPTDCVNPREPPYYAQGSGNSDTTSSIQGAIDGVFAAGGGTVCLQRGHYLVSFGTPVGLAAAKAALIVKSKVVLRCDNEAVIQADTSPTAPDARVIVAMGEGVNDHTHLGMEGCTIDGLYPVAADQAESYFGISILNGAGHTVDGVRLINNEIRNIHGDGISSGQVAIGGATKNVIISGNNIHDDVGQAISEGNGSAGDTYVNFAINGNNLHDTNSSTATSGPEAVIFSPGVSFVSFVGNTVANWGEVSVVGASNMNISANAMHGTHAPNTGHQGAVVLGGANDISNLTVDSNTIDVSDLDAVSGPAGIFINTVGSATLSQVTISGNTIKRGQAVGAGSNTVSGIVVGTPVATGLTIVGNTIFNGLDDATHQGTDIRAIMSSAVTPSKSITIAGNTLQSASTGIWVACAAAARGLGLSINGNTLNGGGILVQDTDGVVIGGNTIRSTTKLNNPGENSGITCLGCVNGSVINGNKIEHSAAAAIGIRLRGATANAIIAHNTINLPGGGAIKQCDEVTAEGTTTNKWIDNEALQTQNCTLDTNSKMIDHINGNVWGPFPALAASSQRWCTDCAIAGACAAGGQGAMALRNSAGAWICQW